MVSLGYHLIPQTHKLIVKLTESTHIYETVPELDDEDLDDNDQN